MGESRVLLFIIITIKVRPSDPAKIRFVLSFSRVVLSKRSAAALRYSIEHKVGDGRIRPPRRREIAPDPA